MKMEERPKIVELTNVLWELAKLSAEAVCEQNGSRAGVTAHAAEFCYLVESLQYDNIATLNTFGEVDEEAYSSVVYVAERSSTIDGNDTFEVHDDYRVVYHQPTGRVFAVRNDVTEGTYDLGGNVVLVVHAMNDLEALFAKELDQPKAF